MVKYIPRINNMELPPWLKIENIIGKLNLSGWFNKNIEQNNTTNNFNKIDIKIILPANSNETAEITSEDEIPLQKVIDDRELELELTTEQKFIVSKINQIHKLNGSNYDFENSYKLSLQHIKNKLSADWFVTAATHMANAIQSGDVELGISAFFDSFQAENDPEKSTVFLELKEKTKYSYARLQNLRHVDKSGEFKKSIISEYQRKMHEQDKISNEDYQQIFTDFQDLLLKLFYNYRIKNL